MGKGENAGYQDAGSFSHNVFTSLLFKGQVKICGKELIPLTAIFLSSKGDNPRLM